MKPYDRFKQLVLAELIPAYVTLPGCNMTPEGFVHDWHRIGEQDAADFLRAMDAELVVHKLHGKYGAPKSNGMEKFFWEGPKKATPRPFRLWEEPIIAVAALARLHFDFGWPKHLLGMQSKDYGFDAACYLTADAAAEHIACEVKATPSGLDRCVSDMIRFGADPDAPEPRTGHTRNAWKKVLSLRNSRAPLFWALGPDRHESVYRVRYASDTIQFDGATLGDLQRPRA